MNDILAKFNGRVAKLNVNATDWFARGCILQNHHTWDYLRFRILC